MPPSICTPPTTTWSTPGWSARMDAEGRPAEGRHSNNNRQQQDRADDRSAAAGGRGTAAAEARSGEIGRLIKRGQQLLASGDIAPARLLLQRAANGGSAQAALILGGTYDPDVLREIGVLGFAPNPARPASGTKRPWNSAPTKPAVGSIAWRRRSAKGTWRSGAAHPGPPPEGSAPVPGTHSPGMELLSLLISCRLCQFGTRPESHPEL